MSGALFPLSFATEEFRLLTGLIIGFLFGFVLERAGFGNARKLAGQFYLNDMTVFKVMFTAILVAMIGMYGLQAVGLADMSMIWINPTFIPAQVAGGFLLGVGFIMSGLCPGTSVVSMVSGRIDAWVAFLGIFLGLGLFTVTVDWFPGLRALYQAGSGEVSVLHEVLGVPALGLALLILLGAALAFVGAEKVEAYFQQKTKPVELTPPSNPAFKLVMAGSLAVVGMLALAFAGPGPQMPQVRMASMAPLSLAQSLIEREPGIVILDLRADPETEKGIPGAVPSAAAESALDLLRSTPSNSTVVIYDEVGAMTEAPATWPRTLKYHFLEGGLAGWEEQVLLPWEMAGTTLAERDEVLWQNQISAFFSGAAVQSSSVSAPPPAMATGAPPKKKAGGC